MLMIVFASGHIEDAMAEEIAFGETVFEEITPTTSSTYQLNWLVEPYWEIDKILLCCAFPWEEWENRNIPAIKTELNSPDFVFCFGHGFAWDEYFFDKENGLFKRVLVHYSLISYEIFTADEFATEVDFRSGRRLRAIRAMDFNEFPDLDYEEFFNRYHWENWLQSSNIGNFAVAYGSEILTDFIFGYETERRGGGGTYNTILVSLGGKWGSIDENGEVVLPFIFDDLNFIDNYAAFAKYNGKYGILQVPRHFGYHAVRGVHWRVEPTLDVIYIGRFSEGLATVRVETRNFAKSPQFMGRFSEGVINQNGDFVIPPIYLSVDSFQNGLAVARRMSSHGYFGVIDREGNVVIPFEYAGLSSVHGQWFKGANFIDHELRFGILDLHGNIVIPFEFEWIEYASEGMFLVMQGEKYGYASGWVLNQDVIPTFDICCCFYRSNLSISTDFSEGMVGVSKGEGWGNRIFGFMDRDGEMVIPFQFQWVGSFNQGLAPVIRDWRDYTVELIDTNGNIVVSMEFSQIEPFSEGLAAVHIWEDRNLYIGFIDKSGTMIVPLKRLNGVGTFSEGLVAVTLPDSRGGFINMQGEMVIPAEFSVYETFYRVGDVFSTFERGLTVVGTVESRDRRYGVLDNNGNIVVPLEFSYVGNFYDGLSLVRTGDWGTVDGRRLWVWQYGYVNRAGEFIVPVELEYANHFSDRFAAVMQDGLWGILQIGS